MLCKKIEVQSVDTDAIAILAGAYFELALAYPLADIIGFELLSERERTSDFTASCVGLG